MNEVLNEINEIVYIIDPDTNELLFMNNAAKKEFGVNKIPEHSKCYELLHNNTKPCISCLNKKLSKNKVYEWEYTNPVSNKHYIIKDKLIPFKDKIARAEIIFDITDDVNKVNQINKTEEIEAFIIESIKTLNENNDFDNIINNFLAGIGRFTKASRIFSLQIIHKEKKCKCMYEWTDFNIPSFLNKEEIPFFKIPNLLKIMKKNKPFVIENMEDYSTNKPEYIYFKKISTQKLFIIPLFDECNILQGMLGIDNYTAYFNTEQIDFLLRTLAVFITNKMEQRKTSKQLEELSYKDSLTNLQNRNKYMIDLESLKLNLKKTIGISFIDMNGLKKLNDSKGHTAGDNALKEIAKELLKYFPLENVYRIGGDEFVIICTNIKKEDFESKMNLIKADSGKDNNPSYSVGSQWYKQISNINKQLKETDLLMYEEKNNYYKYFRSIKK